MRILITSTIILFLDQLTKFLVKTWMTIGDSVSVFGSTVRLTFIYNYGMAFGISVNNKTLFTFISIFAAFIIIYYLYKMKNEKFIIKFPLAIILGGAVGNLFDRIVYGRVADFIDIDIPDIYISAKKILFFNIPEIELQRWPIFNVADIAVTCGMFFLIFLILFQKDQTEKEPTDQ